MSNCKWICNIGNCTIYSQRAIHSQTFFRELEKSNQFANIFFRGLFPLYGTFNKKVESLVALQYLHCHLYMTLCVVLVIMSAVGTDQQFYDINQFCTCSECVDGLVLGVDPTFNLGDLYVTPIVYEHQMVVSKETGKHPIFIGPVLIHTDRKYTTYYI